MNKFGLKCSAAIAALCILPTAVLAQDEIIIADLRIPDSDIVVTANGTGTPRAEIGQAVTEINSDLIKQRQPASISDLLATTPGVTVSRNGGIGKNAAVRIRGAEGDQTLSLIDGVRVNDPSSPGGSFDFGNLLIGNIDRVEILRGPNSVPWGSEAIGGVVNIVTAEPRNSGTLRAEYGYKDRKNIVGNAGFSSGIISASFGAGYFSDDGLSAFKGGAERDGYRQYAANGKIGVAISDDIAIDLRGYYADSKTQLDGFPPPFYSFTDTSDFSTAQELFGYAGVNFGLFNGNLESRVAFTISDINRDNFSAPGQTIPSFLARGRIERYEYQGNAQITDAVRVVFGAEHEKSRFSDGFAAVDTSLSSGYSQFIVNITEAVTLTGGVRLDDHKAYGSEITFGANASWRPSDGTVIRAAYGEGFKAPTLSQLNGSYGNAALQPEEAKSYELGVEQQFLDDQLSIGVTAFWRDTTNQIDFISCFGQTTGICTNRPFGTYDNVGRARAKGVEFSLIMRPSYNFTVDTNYTLIDSKDRSSGLALLRRPKHSVNINADWDVTDRLAIGASLQMLSDSADSDFQTFTRTTLDGYALVGLRASYEFMDGFAVYGRVDNLGDEKYETVSGFGTYGRNAHMGIKASF